MDSERLVKAVEGSIASHNTWASGVFPSVQYWQVNTGEYVWTYTRNSAGEKEK